VVIIIEVKVVEEVKLTVTKTLFFILLAHLVNKVILWNLSVADKF